MALTRTFGGIVAPISFHSDYHNTAGAALDFTLMIGLLRIHICISDIWELCTHLLSKRPHEIPGKPKGNTQLGEVRGWGRSLWLWITQTMKDWWVDTGILKRPKMSTTTESWRLLQIPVMANLS